MHSSQRPIGHKSAYRCHRSRAGPAWRRQQSLTPTNRHVCIFHGLYVRAAAHWVCIGAEDRRCGADRCVSAANPKTANTVLSRKRQWSSGDRAVPLFMQVPSRAESTKRRNRVPQLVARAACRLRTSCGIVSSGLRNEKRPRAVSTTASEASAQPISQSYAFSPH